MKPLYQNTDQLKTVINTLVAIYDENVKTIDPDKHFMFIVMEPPDEPCYKIVGTWAAGYKQESEKTDWADWDFKIPKKEIRIGKLESYVTEMLDRVSANPVAVE